MKKTKLLPLILIIFTALSGCIQFAHAADTLLYYADGGSDNSSVGPAADYGFCNPAVAGNDQYLAYIVIQFKNNSVSESGYINAFVMTTTTGNGTRVENSTNNYNVASLNGVTNVTFYFRNTTALYSSSQYRFGWVCVNTLGSSITAVTQNDGSGLIKSGYSDDWSDNTGTQNMWVYTTGTSGTATPAPLPTGGSYQPTDTDTLINVFIGYLIPLILFLLPALILGWVTHWAKWPILIGLAIGSGLTYLFLGTQYLWLVVMVIIGIASMSYSDFRSNG